MGNRVGKCVYPSHVSSLKIFNKFGVGGLYHIIFPMSTHCYHIRETAGSQLTVACAVVQQVPALFRYLVATGRLMVRSLQIWKSLHLYGCMEIGLVHIWNSEDSLHLLLSQELIHQRILRQVWTARNTVSFSPCICFPMSSCRI
jgi:hypothetical protein